MKQDRKIVIVGAGIAGLVAAIELEKRGYAPVILEATDSVGGRIKTDYSEGYQFDHGFQVLLTAYPELRKYLDLEGLNLKYFKPGATIYSGGRAVQLADPLRDPSSLFAAIFSPAGTILDKWKIWRLTEKLKKMTIDEIFNGPSVTTMEYLRGLGFSDCIIANFFRPFFSGIFLEPNLETSSRLFQFIFKMFAEGYAAIPGKGMQAIPDQLQAQLQNTQIKFNSIVTRISEKQISTSSGDHAFDAVIVATEPGKMLDDVQLPATNFRSTLNMYFAIPTGNSKGYIGLISSESMLINNIAVLTDVASNYAPEGKSLLSATVVGSPQIEADKLVQDVTNELATVLEFDKREIKHLKTYHIKKALPDVSLPTMNLTKEQIKHSERIYLAGDHLLGGSVNGAMVSGRQCVEVLVDNFGHN